MPSLRTFGGAHFWSADPDRSDATGSFAAIGGQLGLRLELVPTARMSPYVYVAILRQNVDASLDDHPALETALHGFNVGAAAVVGAGYALDAARRTRVTAEYRQTFINNFNSWGVSIGFRLVPRGRDADLRIPRYRDPFWGAEAERARQERERLEAERRRVEQERVQEQEAQCRAELQRQRGLDAERPAEQERLARVTEEERRRAQQEIEAA